MSKLNLRRIKGETGLAAEALFVGLAITFLVAYISGIYSSRVQAGISGEILRFHILANSDADYDQDLKMRLKDALLETYGGGLQNELNLSGAELFLMARLDEIKDFAENFVADSGYDYPVSVSLARDSFPTRDYGGFSLPAGRYEALRVVIGGGGGENFWCVMFPPLCFVDEAKGRIKDLLTDEEYALITGGRQNSVSGYKIKFKIVEIWQSLVLGK